MILKLVIVISLGLLSVVSPPVFAGIVLVGLIAIAVCNLDVSMAKLGKNLSAKHSERALKIPCNFLALGLLFMAVFTVAGFAWEGNPHIADETLEIARTCLSIGLHFGSLLIMVGSMYKFVKLVD